MVEFWFYSDGYTVMKIADGGCRCDKVVASCVHMARINRWLK